MEKNGSTHLGHQSSKFDATGYPQVEIDRLTGAQQQLSYEDLDHEDRLERILNNPNIDEWCTPENLDTLTYFRKIPQQWALIKARYKKLGGFPPDLERAVDAQLQIALANTDIALEDTHARQRPVVVSMDTVQAESVEWLWWPYIAVGNLCMLVGDPGVGKSLLMTQLAASLSRGYPLPDQQGQPTLPTGGPHVTLLLCTEDGLA